MTTHRSRNKLERKAHMNIHNTIEVLENEPMFEVGGGKRFTTDRLGRKHVIDQMSFDAKSLFDNKLKKGYADTRILKFILLFPAALLLILTIQKICFSAEANAENQKPQKGPNVVVTNENMDIFSTINGPTTPKKDKTILDDIESPVGENAKIGFNEDGDPSLAMRF